MCAKLNLEKKQAIWRSDSKPVPPGMPYLSLPARRQPTLMGKLDARERELVSLRSRLAQVLPDEIKPPLSAEELAAIPVYPGRKLAQCTSLEWFEKHWQPYIEDKRVGQRELRETDPGLFSALRRWLERRGRRIWELVPPLPGATRRRPGK